MKAWKITLVIVISMAISPVVFADKAAELEKENRQLKQEVGQLHKDVEEVHRMVRQKQQADQGRTTVTASETQPRTAQPAQTTQYQPEQKDSWQDSDWDMGGLGVELDYTYVSKYIWRGFDVYHDDDSASQPSINVDLWDTGFSFNIWASWANQSGHVNGEEWDYTATYAHSFMEDEKWALDWAINYVYYDFPDQPSEAADTQEINMVFELPQICPFGTTPYYMMARMWPSTTGHELGNKGKQTSQQLGGWYHEWGFTYDYMVEGIMPDGKDLPLEFLWNIAYNDGMNGESVDHDWSHSTFALASPMQITDNFTFTPAINYQVSFDDSVNDEDEFWFGLSCTYRF